MHVAPTLSPLGVGVGVGVGVDGHNPPGQTKQYTPPCDEQVPLFDDEQLLAPSVQRAVALPKLSFTQDAGWIMASSEQLNVVPTAVRDGNPGSPIPVGAVATVAVTSFDAPLSPHEFDAFIHAEYTALGRAIKSSGAAPN